MVEGGFAPRPPSHPEAYTIFHIQNNKNVLRSSIFYPRKTTTERTDKLRHLPDKNGIHGIDLPMGIPEQAKINRQTVIVPETVSASATCMGHVAQDGKRKLLEGRGRLGNLLKVRDQSCLCCFFLASLVDPAKVKQCR